MRRVHGLALRAQPGQHASLCNIVRNAHDQYLDLESYGISKEQYDTEKEKLITYNKYPLTKKEFPELSRDERIRRHIEYLKEHNEI